METVDWLSQNSVGVETITESSCSKDWTHITSAVRCAKLLYSASVLLLATTCCFLDHQDMRLGPKNNVAPEIDLLSSTSVAQSASEKPLSCKGKHLAALR